MFLYVLRGGGGPATDPGHAGETTCLDVLSRLTVDVRGTAAAGAFERKSPPAFISVGLSVKTVSALFNEICFDSTPERTSSASLSQPPRLIVDVGNIDEAILEAHESRINHSSVYDLSAASQCALCL